MLESLSQGCLGGRAATAAWPCRQFTGQLQMQLDVKPGNLFLSVVCQASATAAASATVSSSASDQAGATAAAASAAAATSALTATLASGRCLLHMDI